MPIFSSTKDCTILNNIFKLCLLFSIISQVKYTDDRSAKISFLPTTSKSNLPENAVGSTLNIHLKYEQLSHLPCCQSSPSCCYLSLDLYGRFLTHFLWFHSPKLCPPHQTWSHTIINCLSRIHQALGTVLSVGGKAENKTKSTSNLFSLSICVYFGELLQ